MSKRQFSFQKYWEDLSGGHVPLLSFSRADDYESWSRDARAKLLELLGPFPERCDLAAEVEYSVDEGDFIRERAVNAVLDTLKAILPAHMWEERASKRPIRLRSTPLNTDKNG